MRIIEPLSGEQKTAVTEKIYSLLRDVAAAFYMGKSNFVEQECNRIVQRRLIKLQVILYFLICSSHIGLGFSFSSF